METKLPWYKQTPPIILSLLLFFPLGLVLMWVNTKWNKKIKIAVTGFFVLMLIIGSVSEDSTTKLVNNEAKPTNNKEVTVTETKIQPTSSPTIQTKVEDSEYFDGVMAVLGLLTEGNTHIEKVGDLGAKMEFDKALEEVRTAKVYFDSADEKLSKLTPTKKFESLNKILKQMMSNYRIALNFYLVGVENLEATSIGEGVKYYKLGTAELNKAKDEIENISKDLGTK